MPGINLVQVMAAHAKVMEVAVKFDMKERQRVTSKKTKAKRYLRGNKFCFTGKMRRVRFDIQQELHDLGGQSCYGWESGITVLVKVDENWHSTKVDKAKKKDIPIITEEEYNRLIEIAKTGKVPSH